MRLKQLKLFNFKNYTECAVDFHDGINVIVGSNGSGKTNLLDAMHYLSMTKSAFSNPDGFSIHNKEDFFAIRGVFEIENQVTDVLCSLKRGQKKVISVNGSEYERLSEHIGLLPVVMIAPDDIDLIREGSEIRRRFVDMILSQMNREYLGALMTYNRYLKQRNALLKDPRHQLTVKSDIFDPYDVQLVLLSKKLHAWRTNFITHYLAHFGKYYKTVSEDRESAIIKYISKVSDDNYEQDYYDNRQRDIETQRTNMGVHKDDFEFVIADRSIKRYGSQGQKKSFTVALKLAKYQILKEHLNRSPLMLLDDIFDKLDDDRIDALLSLVASKNFGQLFITDARIERTKEVLSKLNLDMKFLYVEDGTLKNID